MHEGTLFNELPLGLFELDESGRVIYYKPERDAAPVATEIVGCNFFDDIASIKQSRELQEIIKNFTHSHQPAQNFNYAFDSNNHPPMPVKVLLARIHEQSSQGNSESVFVHIRKA
ncbi:MAG TPA: hypothetical protein VM934_08670 [Pyrinomonadaceae bacterium]|jgi:hypothetical protein|nr:hypothetical protein [Pyrinomonadaceae bacterium]